MKMNSILPILIYVLFLSFSIEAYPKLILSGISPIKSEVYYDDNSIESFGRLVTGETTTTYVNEETRAKIVYRTSHIYFCAFDELSIVSSLSNIYDQVGNISSSREYNSSNSIQTINMSSNQNYDEELGYKGFKKELKSKCSSNTKKLTRIEIPYAKNDDVIYYALMDKIIINKNIRTIWVKSKNLYTSFIKNEDGEDLIKNGEKVKEYSLDKESKYSMVKFQIDCKANKIQVQNLTSYDTNGNTLYNTSETKAIWQEIVPESFGETTQTFLCSF